MEDDLNAFIKTTYKFQGIDRDIFYPNKINPENDAEHTLQLALVSWYIIEKDGLPLNKEKVFKIALAHDLVEVHAGDTPLWGKVGHEDKKEREQKALEILETEFLENKEVVDAIREYKNRETEEAVFVHALDKLLPLINQLNTEGRVWKNHNVTLEQVLSVLEKQSKLSIHLKKYFESRIEFLKKNKSIYFN